MNWDLRNYEFKESLEQIGALNSSGAGSTDCAIVYVQPDRCETHTHILIHIFVEHWN